MTKRYQNQPWYIKLWRRRHYLRIPFMAVKFWSHKTLSSNKHVSFSFCWKLSIGIVQGDMKWYYTWEEVKERLKNKIRGGS